VTLFIADIASYQHGLIPAELIPACAALEIKATQGSDYVDPDYKTWLPEATAAGLLPIAYHYIDGSAPAAQAAHLKAYIIDASLPVMLDFEAGGFQQALEVADAMTVAGLRPRLLYFARSRWEALGSPALAAPLAARGLALINASYRSTNDGAVTVLYPGDTAPEWGGYGGVAPALWQFTDAGDLAGQRLDVNAYRGSAAQFAALLGEAAPVSPGKPAPSPAPAWPTQHLGSSGYWTSVAQRAVMLAGCDPHGVDGKFGQSTLTAVEAAQKALGAHADGQVGPETWGKLKARTLVVQRALAADGHGAGGTDSEAGPNTAAAVVAFQSAKHLLADGIVGQHTSRALGIAAA
jgi:hypothetical protein